MNRQDKTVQQLMRARILRGEATLLELANWEEQRRFNRRNRPRVKGPNNQRQGR